MAADCKRVDGVFAKLERGRLRTEAEAVMMKLGRLGVAMLLCMLVLAGCNTIAGAGKDVQKVGEKVEEAATK
jgi:entericidin A